MPSKRRPESDRDRQTDKRSKGELGIPLNQDVELFPEEFPEGAYSSPPLNGGTPPAKHGQQQAQQKGE